MTIAIMTSALVMAFLGSWHCGVMCGPFSCHFKQMNDFFSYHLGRLISYLMMGSVLYSGTHFFINTESRILKLVGSIVFGLLFILFGLRQMNMFRTKKMDFKIYKYHFHFLSRFNGLSRRFPIVLGLLTGLLPCAWLYSFLLLSTQMNSWLSAMILILIFWLAALPAFLVATRFMQKLIGSSPSSYQKISAIISIAAGILSVIGHWADVLFL